MDEARWDFLIDRPRNNLRGTREVEEILLDFDGPQIVVLDCSGEKRLAVRADEDGDRFRWIEVPISTLELRHVERGQQAIREALQKDYVWIVDSDDECVASQAWRIDSKLLRDEHLPKHGALLPKSCRKPIPESAGSRVTIDSAVSSPGRFTAIANVFYAMQNVWTAFGEMFEFTPEQSTLNALSAQHGSFDVEVGATDEDAHSQISLAFDLAIRSCTSPEEFKRRDMSPRARRAVLEYLKAVAASKVDVGSTWGENGRAFVSASSAKRRIALVKQDFELDVSEVTELGRFISFRSNTGHFVFEAVSDSQKRYSGYITQASAQANVVVGETLYQAKIRLVFYYSPRGERTDAELLSFEMYERSSVPPE